MQNADAQMILLSDIYMFVCVDVTEKAEAGEISVYFTAYLAICLVGGMCGRVDSDACNS